MLRLHRLIAAILTTIFGRSVYTQTLPQNMIVLGNTLIIRTSPTLFCVESVLLSRFTTLANRSQHGKKFRIEGGGYGTNDAVCIPNGTHNHKTTGHSLLSHDGQSDTTATALIAGNGPRLCDHTYFRLNYSDHKVALDKTSAANLCVPTTHETMHDLRQNYFDNSDSNDRDSRHATSTQPNYV